MQTWLNPPLATGSGCGLRPEAWQGRCLGTLPHGYATCPLSLQFLICKMGWRIVLAAGWSQGCKINKALRLGPGYLSGFPARERQTHRQREAGQSPGGVEACWEVAARPGEGCDPDSPALQLSGRILSLLTSRTPATLHPDSVLSTLILGSALLCGLPIRGGSGALDPVVQRGQHC